MSTYEYGAPKRKIGSSGSGLPGNRQPIEGAKQRKASTYAPLISLSSYFFSTLRSDSGWPHDSRILTL